MKLQAALLIFLGHFACGFGETIHLDIGCEDGNGAFVSPGIYDDDPTSFDWTQVVTGEPGMTFFLQFSDFDVDDTNSDQCLDYVQYYDGEVLIFEACVASDMVEAAHTYENVFKVRLVRTGTVKKRPVTVYYWHACVGCGYDSLNCNYRTTVQCFGCAQHDVTTYMSAKRIICTSTHTCTIMCDTCPEGNQGLCDEVITAKEAAGHTCIVYGKSECSQTRGVGMMTQIFRCFAPGATYPTFGKCTSPCCCSPRLPGTGSPPAISCKSPGILIENDHYVLCEI